MTREEFAKILDCNDKQVVDPLWAIIEPKMKKLDEKLDIQLNELKQAWIKNPYRGLYKMISFCQDKEMDRRISEMISHE